MKPKLLCIVCGENWLECSHYELPYFKLTKEWVGHYLSLLRSTKKNNENKK
jgi:hypothetical protein